MENSAIGSEKNEAEQPAAVESVSKPAKDRKNRKEKAKPLLKVVIRRLPPTMTEEEFVKQIEPMPDHDYFYFVSADWTLGQQASSRAYINFCSQDDIFIFKDKFDGYVFLDARGIEFPAIVEFAPFQGLPKSKSRKKDNKANTIANESHYTSFVETLKESNEGKSESKMEYTFKIKDDQKITSTPLLEYLANVKQERRDERKRKSDERKKNRDEDKQRKRDKVAKTIPESIAEEAKDDEDGVVRTIKSRTSNADRDRNRKGGERDRDRGKKGESDQRQTDKEKRKLDENTRRRESRNLRRQEERQRKREQREKEGKNEPAPVEGQSDSVAKEPTANDVKDAKEDKDRVKKFSESRKERRPHNDNAAGSEKRDRDNRDRSDKKTSSARTDRQNEKNELRRDAKSSKDANEKEKGEPAGDAVKSTESVSDKTKEDRAARAIRNKDRPSLQIYQPGKRRLERQQSNETDLTVSKTSSTSNSPIMDEPSQKKDPPKAAERTQSVRNSGDNGKSSGKHGSKSSGNQRRSSIKDDNSANAKSETGGDKRQIGDKKVSRYSERRNRAKEKREAVSGVEEQLGKLSLDAVTGGKTSAAAAISKPIWSEGDDMPFQ